MASKDLKTLGMLGSMAVGRAKLSAKGATSRQIREVLQPVSIDDHIIANPYGSYNYSLTTVFVPGILMLFMVLLSAYSIGMEMKFDTAKEWLARADGNMVVAIIGKYLIHALVFLFVIFLYLWYIFNVLHFPHLGGVWSIVRLSLLQVAASLGFSIFAFGLMPSLRMSMSISSLWFVLGISMCGSAFPVMGMAAGTARERHKNGQLIPDDDPHFNNAYRIVWGKALCYCMMGVVAAAWLSMAVPRMSPSRRWPMASHCCVCCCLIRLPASSLA